MADLDTLMAFLGGGGSGSNVSDITGFQNQIAQNDLWKVAAAPVLQAKFDTSTWSPMQSFGVSAGQAFLGTLLNEIGNQSESRQLEKVASILPQLYANPLGTETPEGVDPKAFATLKLNTATRADSAKSGQLQKLLGDLMGVKIAGLTEKEKTKAGLQGKQDFYGVGIEDPESPQAKKVQELRDKFNALDATQNFKYVQRLSNQLVQTLKNPSAVADPVLAKMVIQFVEPKLSVNAGEAAGLAASASIPEAWKGIIGQALEGKSKLTSDVRQGLLDIASAAYQAHGKAFQKEFDLASGEAKRYGIDPTRISNIDPSTFYDFTETKPLTKEFLAAERDKLKLQFPGMSPSEIADKLRQMYG